MERFQLADGRVVQADPANPEHAAFLKAEGAKPYGTVGGALKALGSGLAEGAARLPFLGSDLINLGLDLTQKHLNPKWMQGEGYKQFREAHKGSGWVDEGLEAVGTNFYRPKTDAEKYINITGQGVGGGVASVAPRAIAPTARALPILGKSTLDPQLVRSTAIHAAKPAAVSGGVGAVGGQAAMDLTGSDNPLVEVVGSVLTGGLAGAATSRTSKPKKMLSEAAQAATPDDWRQAQENLRKFERQGSTTATLGEAFPGDSPLLGLTKEASAQAGSNAVIRKMGQRDTDLQRMKGQALDAVGPEVGTDVAAANAETAARNRLEQFRKARTAEYSKRLTGAPPMPEEAVGSLHTTLKQLAAQTQDKVQKDALEAVAETLLKPTPEKRTVTRRVKEPGKPARMVQETVLVRVPKTDVRALAVDLKNLRDSLEYNPTTAGTPVKLNAHAFRNAYGIVDDFLREIAPEHYPRAEESFKRFSSNLITPAEKGPLGILAGRSPADNMTVPFARLEGLVNRQAPNEIPRTIASLVKGSEVPANQPPLEQQVARALLQQRVRTGTGELGQKLAGGAPGSLGQEQTQALLQSVGANTSAFNSLVDVINLLSRIQSSAASGGMTQRAKDAGSNWFAALLSPFQEGWSRSQLLSRRANYRDVAALLANPTQENLAILRKLAEQDPGLRLRLGLGAGVLSANTGLPPQE